MTRLFRVILPVDDLERAAPFYAALLAQPGARVSPGRHYFPCGDVMLALDTRRARVTHASRDRTSTTCTSPSTISRRSISERRVLEGSRRLLEMAICRWARLPLGRGGSGLSTCGTRSGLHSFSWTRARCLPGVQLNQIGFSRRTCGT